mmetsp:Transcript_25709/g.60063  ORF Transcript_25709/g.60063 Transcript_25709/m.60063 type:complete len:296 (+) Transcript_25709:470-1357(+)
MVHTGTVRVCKRPVEGVATIAHVCAHVDSGDRVSSKLRELVIVGVIVGDNSIARRKDLREHLSKPLVDQHLYQLAVSVVEALLWLAAALATRRRLIALQVMVVPLWRNWEALPDHGDVMLTPEHGNGGGRVGLAERGSDGRVVRLAITVSVDILGEYLGRVNHDRLAFIVGHRLRALLGADDAHDAVEQRDVLIKVRAERVEVSRQIRNRDVRAHTRRRICRRGPTCATNGCFGNLLPIVRHGRGVFCLATDRLRAHPRPVRGARLRDRRVHGSKEIGAGGFVDQVQCTMTTAVP